MLATPVLFCRFGALEQILAIIEKGTLTAKRRTISATAQFTKI
jgi:hypothetical protein